MITRGWMDDAGRYPPHIGLHECRSPLTRLISTVTVAPGGDEPGCLTDSQTMSSHRARPPAQTGHGAILPCCRAAVLPCCRAAVVVASQLGRIALRSALALLCTSVCCVCVHLGSLLM
jgi:hypothetical protein